MSKSPRPKPTEPPLFDAPDVPTIFATEVCSISLRGGVLAFTLAEERANSKTPPSMERRVVLRFALPAEGVEKMMASLVQMIAHSQGANIKTQGSA